MAVSTRRNALPWQLRAIRPYVRAELPGWGRLYRAAGGGGPRAVRCDQVVHDVAKVHPYQLELHLDDWLDRLHYFLGRPYELHTVEVVRHALAPGEHALDVGANVGCVALLMAHAVGPMGRVLCVEPNPRMVQRLEGNLRLNGLRHVSVAPVALGAAPGFATLHVAPDNPATATLGKQDVRHARGVVEHIDVPITTGDELVTRHAIAPSFVKIDAEGYEPPILDGMLETLRTHRPTLVTEVIAGHLAGNGFAPRDLADRLVPLGYQAFVLGTQRGMGRHRLRLDPIDLQAPAQQKLHADVVWLVPGTQGHQRLGGFVRSAG